MGTCNNNTGTCSCRYGFYPPICGKPNEPATSCAIGASGRECNGTGTCDRLAGTCKCEPDSAGPSCSSAPEERVAHSRSAAPVPAASGPADSTGGISYGEWVAFRNAGGERLRADSNRRIAIEAPDDASTASTFELVDPTGKRGWLRYSAPVLFRSATGRFLGIEAGGSDDPIVIRLTGRGVGRHTVFSLRGGQGMVKAGDWVAVSSPAGYLLSMGVGPHRYASVSLTMERTDLDNLQIVPASSSSSQQRPVAALHRAPTLGEPPRLNSRRAPSTRGKNNVVHYGQYVSLTDRAGRLLLMGTDGHVRPLAGSSLSHKLLRYRH